jgi:hypothetical protein
LNEQREEHYKKLMAFSKENKRDKKQLNVCAEGAMCLIIWK